MRALANCTLHLGGLSRLCVYKAQFLAAYVDTPCARVLYRGVKGNGGCARAENYFRRGGIHGRNVCWLVPRAPADAATRLTTLCLAKLPPRRRASLPATCDFNPDRDSGCPIPSRRIFFSRLISALADVRISRICAPNSGFRRSRFLTRLSGFRFGQTMETELAYGRTMLVCRN